MNDRTETEPDFGEYPPAEDITPLLRELALRLDIIGYSEYYSSFHPLTPRLADWLRHRGDVSEELGPVLDVFLLGQARAPDALPAPLADLVGGLLEAGLLVQLSDGEVSTPGLSLLPVFGLYIFCHTPRANPLFYLGDDSLALLTRLRPRLGGRCLDLCSGPGIQALHSARFASKVVAVEVNPVTAVLAKINVGMNGLDDRVEVEQGSLYETVAGDRFDHISANPPLLPFPESSEYPFVGHGGEDGMRITWKILEGLSGHLATNGIAQLIGTCLSDGILPLCVDRLGKIAQDGALDVTMTVTSHTELGPGASYFEGLVKTSSDAMGTDPAEVSRAFEELLKRQSATHLCAHFLHCTRGDGKLRVHDLSREHLRGLWYV